MYPALGHRSGYARKLGRGCVGVVVDKDTQDKEFMSIYIEPIRLGREDTWADSCAQKTQVLVASQGRKEVL
jgi:hypothetical protein